MIADTQLTDTDVVRSGGEELLSRLTVSPDASILEAFRALERGEQGIVFVCRPGRHVLGTLTDGDLRRALVDGADLDERVLTDLMTRDYVSVREGETDRAHVLDLMLAHKVYQVPVLDGDGRLVALHTIRGLVGSDVRPNAAVIMAGGKGTRLRPYTEEIPKPMVKVAGRPMLERLVLHLVGHGIRTIYLSVNYLAHVIEDHFGDGSDFGCEIRYLREDEPLGTAGALSLLPDRPEDDLLVMNGDLVTQADVGRFLDFHADGGYCASIGVRAHTVDVPYGVAEVSGSRLESLREKPTHEFRVNAGIYVLSPEALGYVPEGEMYRMTDLFQDCLEDGHPVGAFDIEEDWTDVGRPEELMRAHGREAPGERDGTRS